MEQKPQPQTPLHHLEDAHYNSVRNFQIGGKEDGISEEVAKDIGYSTAEEVEEIIRQRAIELGKASIQQIVPEETHDSGVGMAQQTTPKKYTSANDARKAALKRLRDQTGL